MLTVPYPFDKARLVVREMADLLALDLVRKRLVTDQMVLTVGYDVENLLDPVRRAAYHGPVTSDGYGRQVPKAAHGTIGLGRRTSSTRIITEAVTELFERIVDPELTVRRMYVVAGRVTREEDVTAPEYEQMDLFAAEEQQTQQKLARERRMQEAMLSIKNKYGKNAILRGMNFEDGATARERNSQVGGHKA